MTVSLTISKTLTGSAAADSLTGGGSGYDFGQSQTGADGPNSVVYLKHDGSSPITQFAVNLQAYTATYGGDYSANTDLTKLTALGDASYGLQMDFNWDVVTPFSGTYTTFKTGTGVSFATRVSIPVSAMSYNSSGTEVDASAPIAGEMGTIGDTALGDRAHMTIRLQAPAGETATGKRQFDIFYSYNFTS